MKNDEKQLEKIRKEKIEEASGVYQIMEEYMSQYAYMPNWYQSTGKYDLEALRERNEGTPISTRLSIHTHVGLVID